MTTTFFGSNLQGIYIFILKLVLLFYKELPPRVNSRAYFKQLPECDVSESWSKQLWLLYKQKRLLERVQGQQQTVAVACARRERMGLFVLKEKKVASSGLTVAQSAVEDKFIPKPFLKSRNRVVVTWQKA